MATFRAGEHEWRVRLTLGTVGRLREDAGFDLGEAMTAENFADVLLFSPAKLGKVLWVLCRGEAEARGLTVEGFFDLLGPEELVAATTAVVQAVVDFFQPGRSAEVSPQLPGLMERVNRTAGRAMAADLTPQFDAALRKLGGDSPGSSA